MPSGGRRIQLGDKCKNCNIIITKPIAVYKICKDSRGAWRDWLQPRCRSCHKAHTDKVPSRSKEGRAKQYIEWKWKISMGDYNKKKELQFNGCAICRQPCDVRSRLAVDHNHRTGQIRDLLCHKCNMVLGLVNDDERRLFDMIDYLKRHSQKLTA